jgi:predicted AlkP superfamily phosphohydrolase/phosphomutase
MFWGTRDPGHPLYTPAFAKRYAEVIPDVYRHADKLLGHVLECADGKATVMVVSDHGFAPFRRAVHLNSWLVANGFMLLKTAPPDPEGGALFQNVVWEETSAYSLGFSGIYVNVRGREGRGAVAQGSEYRTVCERIASGLPALRDPKTGQCPVRRVYMRDELYHGPHAGQGPDVVVGFESGYRASWQTALGGAPQGIFDDNRKLWSGDHIVDPSCVPGVLLASRPLRRAHLRQTDVAPTVLNAFALQKTPAMNGDSFL